MRVFFCFALLYVATASQKVNAQENRNSSIRLYFREFDIKAEVELPLTEMEIVFGKSLVENPEESLRKHERDLSAYILSHISVTGVDRLPWQIAISSPFKVRQKSEEQLYLTFNLSLHAQNAQAYRKFILFSDIIDHRILSHQLFVIVESDWENGVSPLNPESIGIIYPYSAELVIDRNGTSGLSGFLGIFKIGIIKVSTEFYHLLFILIVLAGAVSFLDTNVLSLIPIFAAFALGQFATLLLVGMGWAALPLRWSEAFIAIAIALFSIQIILPVTVKRRCLLGLAFGFIYGFISSNVISEFSLSAGRFMISAVGLTLGVLVMQCLILLLFAPWFFIAAESKVYFVLGRTLALLGVSIAIVWLITGIVGKDRPLVHFLNNLMTYPVWILAFAAVVSLMVRYYPVSKKGK